MKSNLIYIIIGIVAVLSLLLVFKSDNTGKFINFLNTQFNEELYENLDSLEVQREIYKKATEEYVIIYSELEKERDSLLMEKGSLLNKDEFLDENLLAYEHMLYNVKRPKDKNEILEILSNIGYSSNISDCTD